MVDAVFQFSGGASANSEGSINFQALRAGASESGIVGKTMCPQFWQIQRSSATAFMEWNCPPTTQ
jgi:hypothetical protein